MICKSPVLTEEFVPAEIIYAKDQPEYNPLPCLRSADGKVLTRWTLTDEEREAIHLGADILLTVHTFNQPLQPLRMEVGVCDRDLLAIAGEMNLL
jgi:hypothetical protein